MSTPNENDSEGRKASTKSYVSSGVQSTSKYETRVEKMVRRNLFSSLALLGTILGLTLGMSLRYGSGFYDQGYWEYWTMRRWTEIRFLGETFLDMLTGIKIPLTLSCIAAAIGSMDLKTFSFAFWRMLTYISLTTLLGCFFGAVVAVVFHPGHPEDHPKHRACYKTIIEKPGEDIKLFGNASCSKDLHPCYSFDYEYSVWEFKPGDGGSNSELNPFHCGDVFRADSCEIVVDNLLDLGESLLPTNLINAFLLSTERNPDFNSPNDPKESLALAKPGVVVNCEIYSVRGQPKPSLEDFHIVVSIIPESNVSGLIVCIIFLALAAVCLGDSGRPILNFFTSLSQCTLTIAVWIIWLCPIGICSLVTSDIIGTADLSNLHRSICMYILTTTIALLLYGFGVLPGLYYLFVRKSPVRFYKRIIPLMGMGFGTSHNWAVFPLMIQILEDSCQLDPRIVRLMVPIASQTNYAGAAIYTMASVMYVAQLHGIELDFCTLLTAILATFICLCFKSAKGDFDEIEKRFTIIFNVLQMPGRFYVYIIGVGWIIGRFTTMVDILTRCVGIAIVDHMCSRQLEIMRLEEESRNAAATELNLFNWDEPPDAPGRENPENNISYTSTSTIRQQRKLSKPKHFHFPNSKPKQNVENKNAFAFSSHPHSYSKPGKAVIHAKLDGSADINSQPNAHPHTSKGKSSEAQTSKHVDSTDLSAAADNKSLKSTRSRSNKTKETQKMDSLDSAADFDSKSLKSKSSKRSNKTTETQTIPKKTVSKAMSAISLSSKKSKTDTKSKSKENSHGSGGL